MVLAESLAWTVPGEHEMGRLRCWMFGHTYEGDPVYVWEDGWVHLCSRCGWWEESWHVRFLSRLRVEAACLLAWAAIWWRWATTPCSGCGGRFCRDEDCNIPF